MNTVLANTNPRPDVTYVVLFACPIMIVYKTKNKRLAISGTDKSSLKYLESQYASLHCNLCPSKCIHDTV